jgi:hypothetical protein
MPSHASACLGIPSKEENLLHTSPIPAHSLTKGDVIHHGGAYLRVTAHPTHDYSGPVTRVRLTVIPTGALGLGLTRPLTFGLNQAVARVVGAGTNGR